MPICMTACRKPSFFINLLSVLKASVSAMCSAAGAGLEIADWGLCLLKSANDLLTCLLYDGGQHQLFPLPVKQQSFGRQTQVFESAVVGF